LSAAALLVAATAGLRAEPGRTSAATLQQPLSARAVGMGESFAAVDGGLDSLGYNPAGAARLARPQLQTSFFHGIASDDFGFLGYAHPLPFATVTGGVVYYNAGTINVNYSDGTQQSLTAQQDMVGLLSMALPLGAGLCAGGTAKVYRFELAEQARATGFAGDLGVLWHSPLEGFNLGASLQNLGPDVKFEDTGDPLPVTTRFGAAYDFSMANNGWFQKGDYGFSHFLITADAVKLRDQGQVLPAAGLEMGMGLGAEGHGALRAGYMFLRDTSYFSFGVGFREGRWQLDYGLGGNRNDVANTHHLTFGVSF